MIDYIILHETESTENKTNELLDFNCTAWAVK